MKMAGEGCVCVGGWGGAQGSVTEIRTEYDLMLPELTHRVFFQDLFLHYFSLKIFFLPRWPTCPSSFRHLQQYIAGGIYTEMWPVPSAPLVSLCGAWGGEDMLTHAHLNTLVSLVSLLLRAGMWWEGVNSWHCQEQRNTCRIVSDSPTPPLDNMRRCQQSRVS